jgi:uncharacterized protein
VSDGVRLLERLERVLSTLDGAVVAVSGGVDSMTLAAVAGRMPALDVEMAHAVSPAVPPTATARVRAHAAAEGWRLTVLDAGEFGDADYRANPVDRCRYCKAHLYGAIRRRSSSVVLSGTNVDDLGDYRPGLEAAAEHGVRHPYVEADVDKAGVRAIARASGLEDLAELPATPCLSSRIETGIPIEARLLAFVDRAEREVREALEPGVVRVRVRRDGVVVELDPATLEGVRRRGAGELRRTLEGLAADARIGSELRFAAYRMGSAFLRTGAGAPGTGRATAGGSQ